jgi:glc operon protein GlcG
MRYLRHITISLFVLALGATVQAQGPVQVVDKKALTLDGAKKVIAAAAAEARKNNAGGVIAVVDDGGNLMALERLEGTFAAGANIAIGKARTAALFKRPTKAFEDVIKNGRTAMVALNDFTPLQGGIPIVVDGQVIGAVGVSGANSAQQDEDFATAAANALKLTGATHASIAEAPASAITYLDHEKVAAAFAKGMPLLEVEGYKVHASRRTDPGVVEVHLWETDVVYVLEGSATLVTGGTMVDPKVISPGEIRGPSVIGGESRRIAKGDVIVIPQTVPHWFKEVTGPLLYFVVKPISMDGNAQ